MLDLATTFEATLQFVRPIPVGGFSSFVMQTYVRPIETTFSALSAEGKPITLTVLGSEAADYDKLQQRIKEQGLQEVLAQQSRVLLDEAIYRRVKLETFVVVEGASKPLQKSQAELVLDRWKRAAGGIRTARGSQTLRVVLPDGSPAPVPTLQPIFDPEWTDEVYQIPHLPQEQPTVRFRYKAHYSAGDVITVCDGKNAYRYATWWEEMFSVLPEGSQPNEFWIDDIGDRGFLMHLYPSRAEYTLIGQVEVDGRKVLRLEVPIEGSQGDWPNGEPKVQVLLDEATYLPYRILRPPVGAPIPYAFERTIRNLQVNAPVADADFAMPAMQAPANIPIVYTRAHWGPMLETYADEYEAAKAAEQSGFALFAPDSGNLGEISAVYIVEKDGKRSPAISMLNGAIVQGLYLPQSDGFAFPVPTPGPVREKMVDIDGQPAKLLIWPTGALGLTMSKEGTLIKIGGYQKEDEIVEVARGLRKVK